MVTVLTESFLYFIFSLGSLPTVMSTDMSQVGVTIFLFNILLVHCSMHFLSVIMAYVNSKWLNCLNVSSVFHTTSLFIGKSYPLLISDLCSFHFHDSCIHSLHRSFHYLTLIEVNLALYLLNLIIKLFVLLLSNVSLLCNLSLYTSIISFNW